MKSNHQRRGRNKSRRAIKHGILQFGASTAVKADAALQQSTALARLLVERNKWVGAGHSTPQVAGRLAERLHQGSLAADAARRGVRGPNGGPINVASTVDLSRATDPIADLLVLERGHVLAKGQSKFCGTSHETARQIASSKYGDAQRIVPSDQLPEIKDYLKKNGNRSDTGGRNREALDKVGDRLQYKSASSRRVSRKEAHDAVTNPRAAVRRAVVAEVGRSAAHGAKYGAAFGAVSELAFQMKNLSGGKTTAAEAAVSITKATAKGAVSGAGSAAAGVVVKRALEATGRGLIKSTSCGAVTSIGRGAMSVSRSAGAVAGIVSVGFGVGSDLIEMSNGKLTGEQVAERGVKHVGRAAASWGGAEGGAVLGTAICPGVGTAVGFLVGGFLGAVGFDTLFD